MAILIRKNMKPVSYVKIESSLFKNNIIAYCFRAHQIQMVSRISSLRILIFFFLKINVAIDAYR